jgi:dGTP triphosphohydrolase
MWNKIIAEINNRPWVKQNIRENKKSIKDAFGRLFKKLPNTDPFLKMQDQVRYYYHHHLSANALKARVVAHYIATLTDDEVRKICRR